MEFLIAVVVSVALNVIATMLLTRHNDQKPDAAQEMEDPTAEAGKPIPVPFGTITVKAPNVLWFGEKSTREFKVRA